MISLSAATRLFYTRQLLEQGRPKWLPETSNEPKRLCSLVQCSHTTRVLLVGRKVDPWVDEVRDRSSQSSRLFFMPLNAGAVA